MNIIVVGAGAMGSLLGALLSKKHKVILIGRAAHAATIRANGLRIEGQASFTATVDARDKVDGLAPPDLVLLTVKAYDTKDALRAMKPLIGPKTILVTAQNGLGNWEAARAAYPKNPILAASITYGAFLQEAGHVQWNGTGEIVIGGTPADPDQVARVVEAFETASLRVKAAQNVQGTLWMKAIVNACINPLTAIHRVPNGRILEDPVLRETMRGACDEARKVAASEGVLLPTDDPLAAVENVARTTATNRSSMLQSIERGQRTEIDAITGEILAVARRHGIPCPINEKLFAAVKELEPRY